MSNVLKFGKKSDQNVPKETSQNSDTPPSANLSFEEIVRRNIENAERVRREREKANKNVLRSYRIK